MSGEGLSYAQYIERPKAQRFLRRMAAESYAEFIEVLYDDVHDAIRELERSANLRQDDSEDRITADLCMLLGQTSSYSALHDVSAGGHVDVTVKHLEFGHTWIAEAKIFTGAAVVYEGFLQLTTRYISPLPEDKGGMLIYIKEADAASHMQRWRDKLQEQTLPQLAFSGCSRKQINFVSSHLHQSTGVPFIVWHASVILHHAPQDRSGRQTQARRTGSN